MNENDFTPASYTGDVNELSYTAPTAAPQEDNSVYYTAPAPADFDSDEGNGVGIASLILGILSVLCCCCCCCNVIFVVPALICAIIGMCKRKGNGFAIAGLILAIIGALLTVTFSVYFLSIDNYYVDKTYGDSSYSEESDEPASFEELFEEYMYGDGDTEEQVDDGEDYSDEYSEEEFEDFEEFFDLLNRILDEYAESEEA